jgi:hypothetical protein
MNPNLPTTTSISWRPIQMSMCTTFSLRMPCQAQNLCKYSRPREASNHGAQMPMTIQLELYSIKKKKLELYWVPPQLFQLSFSFGRPQASLSLILSFYLSWLAFSSLFSKHRILFFCTEIKHVYFWYMQVQSVQCLSDQCTAK